MKVSQGSPVQAVPDTSTPNLGLLGDNQRQSWVHIFAPVGTSVWRPKIEHSILKQAPSLNLALTSSARLAGQKIPGFLSSLPLQHLLLSLALMWVLGVEFRSSCLCGQHLIDQFPFVYV